MSSKRLTRQINSDRKFSCAPFASLDVNMNEVIIEFLTAVLEQDYVKLDVLLSNGLDVGVCCEYGNTAIRNASQDGSIEMLRYLISKGANVNERINFKSPVDSRKEKGFSPISYAHDEKTLRYLVAEGAEINAICEDGYTALIKCCKYVHDEMVPIIKAHVECGADLSFKARIGKRGKLLGPLDVAKDTKAFYERLYKKAKNEKLLSCIRNADKIIACLSA